MSTKTIIMYIITDCMNIVLRDERRISYIPKKIKILRHYILINWIMLMTCKTLNEA